MAARIPRLPAIAPFGGRYLARGTAASAYESGLKKRIVISEFPSVEKAIAAHDSPAYQDAVKALGDGAPEKIDRSVLTAQDL